MNFSNTNLNLYNTFIAVFESKSMNRVAQTLNVSRALIGQRIKELSNQLGVTLFTPHQKGVIPTGEANNLYPLIKNALTLITEAESGLKSFTSDSTGIIKIAMSNTHIELYVKDYIKEFLIQYPKIQLEIFDNDGIDMLKAGKIDFVLNWEYLFKGTVFRTTKLFSITDVFIASREFLCKHGLSKNISKGEFLKLPIIMHQESSGEFLRNLDTGIKPHVIKMATNDMVYSLTKSGIGIGWHCNEVLDKAYSSDTDIVRLNIRDVSQQAFNAVCGYNKTLSQPARVFVDGLIKFCKT